MFVLFDLVLAGFVILLFTLLFNEQFWASFWSTVVFSVVGYFVFRENMTFLSEITAKSAILASLGYIAVGYAFSMIKWAFYVNRAVNKISTFAPTKLEAAEKAKGNYSFNHEFSALDIEIKNGVVKLNRSKDFVYTINAWAAWWPFLVVLTVFDDILRNMFNFLTKSLGKLYQAVLDSFAKELN